MGQPAKDGVIDLTAANGFFDRCFVAVEPGPMAPGDGPLIPATYGALAPSKGEAGDARWHVLLAKPGEIRVGLRLRVPAGEAGLPWTVKVGDESRVVQAAASDGSADQPTDLVFKVARAGKVEVALAYDQGRRPVETKVAFLRLTGEAVRSAHLLRARWRPAAVHARFAAPPSCPRPDTWVFESKALTPVASYSPMTTPFGYFGSMFGADGRVPVGGQYNFSMWVASAKAAGAPPLPEMSRLLATSLPEAEFSTFGHEGTGVKFRNAVAYPKGASRIIQALRAEHQDGLWTYHGYFYDEDQGRWRLYASAQNPNPRLKPRPGRGLLETTGSFCEVPGPPALERSGDRVRSIVRRGWFLGEDGRWHAAMPEPGKATAGKGAAPSADDDEAPAPGTNRRVARMPTYEKEGWVLMSTGGVDFHDSPAGAADNSVAHPALPDYLSPDKTAQLRQGPVRFDGNAAKALSGGAAEVTYRLGPMGPSARAVLHFGTVDCLTFVAGKPVNNSPAERDIYSPARTWQRATPAQSVAPGANVFRVEGLTPGTTYHYRLFVSHAEGKAWDAVSGSLVAR